MTRPTGEDAMSSEHVEVLREMRGWRMPPIGGSAYNAALDAAIAALSAPQPPAEAQPERYACNGPEGTFWTDDAALANKLIGAAFDRDEWTVTDTQNPTGAAPPPERARGVEGLVVKWKKESESLDIHPAGLAARRVCAIELEHALAQQPAAVDEAMVAEMAKKLLKLRLTEVGGRKENPATTVKACLKAGLGGLYDDEVSDYIVRAVLRYRDAALAVQQGGES